MRDLIRPYVLRRLKTDKSVIADLLLTEMKDDELLKLVSLDINAALKEE